MVVADSSGHTCPARANAHEQSADYFVFASRIGTYSVTGHKFAFHVSLDWE